MTIQEFLKPEFKKFILPALLIIVFVIVITFFYSLGSVLEQIDKKFKQKSIEILEHLKPL